MRKGRWKRQGGSEGRGAQASGHSGEEGGEEGEFRVTS